MIAILDSGAAQSDSRGSSAWENRDLKTFRTDLGHEAIVHKQLPRALSEMRRCDTVNGVLIDIHRSLLQYAGECSPWVSPEFRRRFELLRRLSSEQRKDVARLCGWLDERDWAVNFGAYPREYSSHNYVDLDTLWTMVVDDQEMLVTRLEHVIDGVPADDEAGPVLNDILACERRLLEQLREPDKAATDAASAVA